MDDIELEEGEACSYHNDDDDDDDDDDPSIDPDVALSYIDEKLQNYLGHFKKDFEGVVSAESLGAKFGIYGSFLPAYRRSPHSRTPTRVQNNVPPHSLNVLQVEGGHNSSLPPVNISSSTKQPTSTGRASFNNYKPPERNDQCSQNTSTKTVEEIAPKSKVRDQKILKVRIKVGSENLLVKKNAEIYSGLGLDWSPNSSPDASPMENEGLSCRSFDNFESPTHILQIMVPPSLFEDCLLSPLSNDLIYLCERPIHLKDCFTQLSSKENSEISLTEYLGHQPLSVNDQETCSDIKSKQLVDKKKRNSQDDGDEKNNIIGSPLSLKETVVDDVSCEELVSSSLKLPFLSNAQSNIKNAPRTSLNERVFNDALNKEPLEPVSTHLNSSEKSNGMVSSSGKPLNNQLANVGDVKSGKEECMVNFGTSLMSKKISKIGPKDLTNQGDKKSSSRRNEVQKDSTKVRDRYIDVFGDLNEPEVDIMDSLDVDTATLDYDNTLRERKSSLRGSTNGASMPDNGHPVFEPVSTHVDGNDNWVQCDKCMKWRMLPPGSKVDNLPPEWDCSLMTWLPYKNRCSVSEEESNNFHAPPPNMTCANILNNFVRSNGKITSKVRKTSNLIVQDSANGLSSSIKNYDQSVKDKTMKEPKEPYKEYPKTGNIYKETGQHKKIDNHRSDSYSDGGHDNVKNRKGKRGSDQEFPSTSKKSKIQSIQSGNNDPTSACDQYVDILGIPSFDKKRKGDNMEDPSISTPSSMKLDDDSERSSRKKHKASKSEGKESSSSKRSGKGDKKSKSVSHHKLDTNESLQKDSSFVSHVGPTSSSSKASGSLKVKCTSQGVKGSPVESVSSSPLRTLNSDELASESKVKEVNDDVPSVVKMETNSPLRCSTYNEGGKLGATRKDQFSTSSFHGSPNYSIIGIENKSKVHDIIVKVDEKEQDQKVKVDVKCLSNTDKIETSNILQPSKGSKGNTSTCDAHLDSGLSKEFKVNKKIEAHNGNHFLSKHAISNGHKMKTQDAPSPLRRDSSCQAASSAIKEAKDLKHLADRLKNSGSIESTGMYFEAALKFLYGASLLESGKNDNHKHADIAQSIEMYSSTAKLCQFCAHEFEKSRDMANAALAYKCVEVAYLRVIYASRDRHELQHALQMLPPGESPSSSASDIDSLNNPAIGDNKVTQARSGGSPQPPTNLVIAAKNRVNFSKILSFTQNVNLAMEASRKSRIAFGAANGSMGHSDSKEGITSIKKALDFNFHDVDGLLRLVRLAKETISR